MRREYIKEGRVGPEREQNVDTCRKMKVSLDCRFVRSVALCFEGLVCVCVCVCVCHVMF